MTDINPIIYLPIEFRSRELDSKALLATTLVRRGYTVVIGQQWLIYHAFKSLPRGVVLFKSFNKIHHPNMANAKALGFKIAVLEEELLAHIEEKAILNYCADGIFDLPEMILANGSFEKNVLDKASGGRIQIDVTGNGRVDLLKPGFQPYFQKDIDAVRARFDDFILVNTNFGIINTLWDDIKTVTDIHVRAGFIKLDDPASVQAWDDQIQFEIQNRAVLLTALKELSRRRPQQKIVVRPHPGEALERWNNVFSDRPNISVVREGAHVPWTLASKLLLHTSCTTGFEAQAAGKTALSLVGKPSWISQSFISNHLNPLFTDPIELVDATERFLSEGPAAIGRPATMTDPEHYVWNFGQQSGVERIADILTAGLSRPQGAPQLPRFAADPRSDKLKSKFDISMEDFVTTCRQIVQTTGQSTSMDVLQLGESLFALAPR